MTHKVTKPIALDESFRTTEQNPQNIADVLANKLDAIKSAIENGGSDEMEAAFECHYNVTSATDIYNAMQEKKVPFFYQNGVVAQLWKVETNKYTFRTTSTRVVEGENILDIVDYIVNGSVWSTSTKTISGGSSSQQAYLAKVESSVNFDTTGLSGMQSIISVNDIPADGVYQLSIFMCITPKTASATKSDLVFQFTGTSGTGMPNTTFHAVVDDSQTFGQQLSFSTTLNLKAGTNSLKLSCGGFTTQYLVFVDNLTVAGLVIGGSQPVPVVTSGANIYPSLQDAISDAANLSIGDIFETNGFHSSGDGGAARYLVSDTGTANGMDIVQLATGKFAVLQIDDGTATPEQFGYNRWNREDLTPVMNRMQTVHVRNIVLSPLESGDNFPYLMKTTFTPQPSIRIASHFDFNTGASGRIWFVPSSYGTDHTVMFQLTNRGFCMKDVVLMNRSWFTESDKHNCVCFRMAISGYNNMWYEFDSLAVQGFDIGVLHENVTGQDSSGLIWHFTFRKMQMALNNINVYLRNVNYLTRFENCFFTSNDSGARSIVLEETFTTEFERCNFGIYNPATTVVDFTDFIVAGKAVDRRFSQAKFTNCNFEIESDGTHPLPTSNKGFFMRFGDHDEFSVELDNCDFIITPLVRNNIYGCRPIQLGANTRMKISNTSGPYSDVNYTANEFYAWDYCKRIFDESKPPRKNIGSLIIEHCIGIIPPPNNQWGSSFLPAVKTDDTTSLLIDDSTDFVKNYPNAPDGVMLTNLDKANLNVKLGSSIVQVTSPGLNTIRIGDRVYNYVTIDGRKWITENLQLWTMNTRQWHFPSHDEFGFYYGPETWTEIDALLPAGWRRPNYNDCQSLISQGYAALEATGYSQWTGATNTTGFSGLPCGRWRKPNVTPDFNRGFIWGPEEVGIGYHAICLQASSVSYAGWTYADATSTNDPVRCVMRVCCDV